MGGRPGHSRSGGRGSPNTQLISGQTAHGNGKGEACDGKAPRRTETAHGKGEADDGKGQRRKGKADDGKGHGEGKAVDEEALVAVEKAGLQGASAKQRKALRSAWRMARPAGERNGAVGLAACPSHHVTHAAYASWTARCHRYAHGSPQCGPACHCTGIMPPVGSNVLHAQPV